MIKTFTVEKLNGRNSFKLEFNPDLNILTGKNGSGKTTALKLLWYMMSGNLERIAPEIDVESAELVTDKYTISFRKNPKSDEGLTEWRLRTEDKEHHRQIPLRGRDNAFVERLNREIVEQPHSSIFFPTFRRIEGGFSMHSMDRGLPRDIYRHEAEFAIEHALMRVADRLSVRQHRFVSSISTKDIVAMLTKEFAEVSEQLNRSSASKTQLISRHIENYEHAGDNANDESGNLSRATAILDKIQKIIAEHNETEARLLRPFNALNGLILDVFLTKGIKITTHIMIGTASEAVASDTLSAGEKQMLSFLAYNAFSTKSTIFIDEPELSLHVDWQRMLFPLLLSQETSNQFVIATHSPFIYSKYPDRELVLDADRGMN